MNEERTGMAPMGWTNPRERIAAATVGLFAHAEYPLAHSLDYRGDPGLFGPDSATWQVVGDISVMVGGIRALLVQAAHPEVAAGVADHSTYESDPLGRLSRTTAYVTSTSYGAMPEVTAALDRVRQAHRGVVGESHRSRTYSANSESGASWVHNCLAESFLHAYQVFGPAPLKAARADQFAREQANLGRLLRATDTPTTERDLTLWVETHPDIATSPAMEETVAFLVRPPLPLNARVPYQILVRAAAATLPPTIAEILGIRSLPGAITAGRSLVSLLRWSVGSSSSWWLALERVAAEPPQGIHFRYPPPVDGIEELFARS
jgi:uncharacterized protein (DUF2236 family)